LIFASFDQAKEQRFHFKIDHLKNLKKLISFINPNSQFIIALPALGLLGFVGELKRLGLSEASQKITGKISEFRSE
jgi:hypothetical protein